MSVVKKQSGECVVMIGEEACGLRYGNVAAGSVSLRSGTNSLGPGNILYREGQDFTVDMENGALRRTPGSRIPDWKNHILFGKIDFDHQHYQEYGNENYTCVVDYAYEDIDQVQPDMKTESRPTQGWLPNTCARLAKGIPAKYVVFGDSISTGAEASGPEWMYFNRFADCLRRVCQETAIDVVMKAKGGETSSGGLERYTSDVLSEKPDLITIGYGANDQVFWEGKNYISPDLFRTNLETMVNMARKETQADIILVTFLVPNPLWKYASKNVAEYSRIIREVGESFDIGVADAQTLWLAELEAGKNYQSLLMNNINHPNDYGHRIYFQAFSNLLAL